MAARVVFVLPSARLAPPIDWSVAFDQLTSATKAAIARHTDASAAPSDDTKTQLAQAVQNVLAELARP